eukprot:285825_1
MERKKKSASLTKNTNTEQVKCDYGQSLFNYFCDGIKWICIRDFQSFPFELFNVMFTKKLCPPEAVNEQKLSMMPVLKLFPHLKEIVLNDIALDAMIEDGNDYIK